LAKALKSSAFWKLGIAITWILRLYEGLIIDVMYNIFTTRNVHLSLSWEWSNTTNYNSCHGWTHFVFFSKMKIFGNVKDHQTVDQDVC
jgi:hypothetical protein